MEVWVSRIRILRDILSKRKTSAISKSKKKTSLLKVLQSHNNLHNHMENPKNVKLRNNNVMKIRQNVRSIIELVIDAPNSITMIEISAKMNNVIGIKNKEERTSQRQGINILVKMSINFRRQKKKKNLKKKPNRKQKMN